MIEFYGVNFIFMNNKIINWVYSEFASYVPGFEALLMLS